MSRDAVSKSIRESLDQGLGVRGAKNILNEKIREGIYESFENNHDKINIR